MNFDRLGEQQVLKRRRPSPIRKARRPIASHDAFFSQDVWPRHRQRETVSGTASFAGGFDKIRQFVFGGIAPGNIEKPKKRKNAAKNTSYRATTGSTAMGSATVDGGGYGYADEAAGDRQLYRLFGFEISVLVVKALAFAVGLLVIGIVGLNWDNISGSFSTTQGIPYVSLRDPVSPLQRRTADFYQAQTQPLSLHSVMAEHSGHFHPDIPLNLTKTFYWTPYVVRPGDTISGIAARHSLSQGSIIALNDIRESWNLQIGRTLKIPNMDGIPYTVVANDTLGAIASRMGVPLNVLLDANDLDNENIVPGQLLFIPGGRMDAGELRRAILRAPDRPMVRPVRGRITSGFGWREDPFRPGSGSMQLHRAVDLAGRIGDPIQAAMQGTVLYRGANPTLGNFIILRHDYYQTLYAHLSAFSVNIGETVRQGQEIGRIGNTGRATGPHLHFAVFYRGEPVNPVDLWR